MSTLPAAIKQSNLASRDTLRQFATRKTEVYAIALDNIVIRPGFNVRTDMGDLRGLADSILQNGQSTPGRVDAITDGTFMLTDGHRRYEAMRLIAADSDAPLFLAIINDRKISEDERILQMFTTQDNKPLTPTEQAELIRRLVNMSWKVKDIAVRLGRSRTYVDNMLSYSRESEEIKDAVNAGYLTVAKAVKIGKAIPDREERVKAVKNAAEKATTEARPGKAAKVLTRDVVKGGAKHVKCAKEIAISLRVDFDAVLLVINKYF